MNLPRYLSGSASVDSLQARTLAILRHRMASCAPLLERRFPSDRVTFVRLLRDWRLRGLRCKQVRAVKEENEE